MRIRHVTHCFLLACGTLAAQRSLAREPLDPAEAVRRCLAEPHVQVLLDEVLARNPAIAAARRRFGAAEQGPIASLPLPDPTFQATALTEGAPTGLETTDLQLMVTQQIPARGKRGLRVAASRAEASAVGARVDVERLRALTEARRWYYELAFLDATERALREERDALVDFTGLARSRYSVGAALQQDVLEIEARRTRAEMALLDVASRRRQAVAALNSLRDMPSAEPVPEPVLPLAAPTPPGRDALLGMALTSRPELSEGTAAVAAADAGLSLARLSSRPDLTIGGFYGAMGLGTPSVGGDADQVGVVVGLGLPIHRRRVAADVQAAAELRAAAGDDRRSASAAIEREVADALARLDEAGLRQRLVDEVLAAQTEQSFRAALSGYAVGSRSALDVLDAARLRFDAVRESARARADGAIAAAELEGAIAAPLPREDGPCSPRDGDGAAERRDDAH